MGDLGNMVRAALDPFGVDVHVDIETPGGEKKCVNKKKSCGAKAKAPEKTAEKTPDSAEKPAEPIDEKTPEPTKEPESKASTPDEEWTVLDKAGSPEPKGAEALYPQLEEKKKESIDTSSLSPKVQVALMAMEYMGFTNDGGWLSNLLTKYDGDIGKVLDLLSPAKPIRN